MVAKLKPDVFVNTNPFLDAMYKERLSHKGYSDKIALSINDKKYNVNSKDIENILDGKGDLFKNVHCGSLFAIFFLDLILKKSKV